MLTWLKHMYVVASLFLVLYGGHTNHFPVTCSTWHTDDASQTLYEGLNL